MGFILAIILLGMDALQRSLYLSGAAAPIPRGSWTSPGTHALLIAGQTVDATELATCKRDLGAVDGSLAHLHGASLRTQVLAPPESVEQLEKALATSRSDEELVIFLTGHGGGPNFGCGRFNIGSRDLARILNAARYRHLLLVIDCCWSGQMLAELKGRLPNADIVSSTDATHEAPFASSFLSPTSFGPAFFKTLEGGSSPADCVLELNRRRARWNSLYPANIGTQGLHAGS